MTGPVPGPEVGTGEGTRWRVIFTASVAGLGMFLAAMDISVNVALPAMTDDLDANLQSIQWVIVAFVATRAGLVMGAGSFADRFGLRPVFLWGTGVYLVSMFCIAFSPDLTSVVGFRVLQAVGTGCLYAVSPAIAAHVFPRHRRGLAMGFTAGSQALGMLAGTLGAGLLVRWLGWEWVFFGRVPFAVIAIFLALLFMEKARASGRSGPAFDVAGAFTLVAGILCLVIGLRLGRAIGWDSPGVLVLLPLAPVFIAAFWRVEGSAQWPVLPRELLRIRGFVVSSASIFLAHFGVFVIWFIFPFYIADSLGKGALALGLMLATMAIFNTSFSGIGGWLADKTGTLPVGLTGLLVLAAGMASMGFLETSSSLGQVAVRIGIVGAGLGLFQASAYAMMIGSVPSDRFATAGAALSLAQACGTVLAVAVMGGVFAFRETHYLAGGAAEASAFIDAFRDVFIIGAAVGLSGAVIFVLGWPVGWRTGNAGPKGDK